MKLEQEANGYASIRPWDRSAHPEEGSYWHKNPAANSCLKSATHGEVIHIALTDDAGDDRCRCAARFMARVELTETTALGLLHFLRHLDGVVLSVYLIARRVNTDLLKLDWLVAGSGEAEEVPTYRFPRLHCWSFNFNEEFNESTELIPSIPRFFFSPHFHTVQLGGIWRQPIAAQMEKIMAVSRQTRLAKELELASYLDSEGIDHVVQHLQQEMVELKTCVPHILFYVKDVPLEEWPSSFPPREADSLVPYRWGTWWRHEIDEGYESE
jgi:hypothetical protein